MIVFLFLIILLPSVVSCDNNSHNTIYNGHLGCSEKDSIYIYDNNYNLRNVSSHNGGLKFQLNNGLLFGIYVHRDDIMFVNGKSGSQHYSIDTDAEMFKSIYGVDTSYVKFIIKMFRQYSIRYINYNPNIIRYDD